MTIDWSQVEVGDVVEWRNGERTRLPPRELDQWDVFYDDGKPVLRFGHTCYDVDEILAIHKPGTVGALSHEERSRLWDKCEEYDITLIQSPVDDLWEATNGGNGHFGTTRLEAVMKCVAAIGTQDKPE